MTSLPCKLQRWRNFNTRSLTFINWSWKLIWAWQVLVFFHPYSFSIEQNFSQCFFRLVRMTSPLLKCLSRRKLCQNLDTTAQSVQKWAPQKTPPKPLSCRLVRKRPKEMVSGRDNKNGKPVKFRFSKIRWTSKVSLLANGNDGVARNYRFSVPLTCIRAIIRQKVY